MKTIENQGFLTAPHAMGWSVPAKTPAEFENVNEINGFVHDSYGTALKSGDKQSDKPGRALPPFGVPPSGGSGHLPHLAA